MASTQIRRRLGASISVTEDGNKKKTKVESEKDAEKSRRKSTNSYAAPSPKKPKHENDARHFKFARKRAFSLTGGNGKYLPLHKRRKKEGIIPPTKFLLGGNIYDPLNLNSLQDEEINRAVNAVTPRSSPLPTPRHRKEEIQVLIPPNINDPLNLAAGEDGDNFELKLISPKKRKARRRKKHTSASPTCEGKEDQQAALSPQNPDVTSLSPPPAASVPSTKTETFDSIPEGHEPQEAEVDSSKDSEESPKEKDRKAAGRKTGSEERKPGGNNRKILQDTKDKIVSPVVPQPGARKRPPAYGRSVSRVDSSGGVEGTVEGRSGVDSRRVGAKAPGFLDQNSQAKRNFNQKSINYQYGNYNRYYGYRNPNHNDDNRLQYLRQDLFEGKDVLDIGCNVGHITLVIARDLGARSVIGMDIDKKLIEAARNNVRHYVGNSGQRSKHRGGGRHPVPVTLKQVEEKFPASMPILYGPIDAGFSHVASKSSQIHKRQENKGLEFPHNVQFVQGNYVLDCDLLLETEQPKFDVILGLSITKWIHLNWGDEGLKRAFRRMFLQLRPGGKLILEPQAWASYKRKKNVTETISKNYHRITLFPQKFTQYLLSEVGFRKCEVLGMPQHPSKGFQRPIQLFYKDGASPRSDCGEGPSQMTQDFAEQGISSASPSFQSSQQGRCSSDTAFACADSERDVGQEDQSGTPVENLGGEDSAGCTVRGPGQAMDCLTLDKDECCDAQKEPFMKGGSSAIESCNSSSGQLGTTLDSSYSDSVGESMDEAGKSCVGKSLDVSTVHSEEINENSPVAKEEKEHSKV